MRIATWNINSVRLRLDNLLKLTAEEQPDIICLQETKVRDEDFPELIIKTFGYDYIVYNGEKSYNGVAILSRIPFTPLETLRLVKHDSRHLSVGFENGLELHNFYIPAGGDEPDVNINPKFAHKLDYCDQVKDWFSNNRKKSDKIMLVGDLNIAPLENDVWSHKQLINEVSHTPIEIEKLMAIKDSLGFHDTIRKFVPETEKIYSWWSYRNRDWRKSNRGRRLDHIWTTVPMIDNIISYNILKDARDWELPSDHVPVMVNIK